MADDTSDKKELKETIREVLEEEGVLSGNEEGHEEEHAIGTVADRVRDSQVTRRAFLKLAAMGAGGFALASSGAGASLLSGTTIGGNTVWHAGNDGFGSGLTADLVGTTSSDPSSPSDARIWYNSDTGELKARLNGMTTTIGSTIPDPGVAQFTFNDENVNGSTALESWNGYDASIDGSVTTGVQGYDPDSQAFDFSGGSVLPPSDDVQKTGSFTVVVWINPDSITGHIYTKYISGVQAVDGEWRFWFTGGGEIGISPYDGGWHTHSDFSPSTDSWQLVAGGYDDDAGEIFLYHDTNRSSASANLSLPSCSTTMAIGNEGDGSGGFDGQIDYPRLYDRALTQDEIESLYNA